MRKIHYIVFSLAFILSSLWSNAQVTLTGTSYNQNFDGIASGYPTGWSVKAGANATLLGTDSTLHVAKTKWNSTTKGVYNYASADGLTSASDSASQANSTDRALGVRQTSGFGDPGVAFTLKIANTTNMNSFNLSFKIQSLDAASPRTSTFLVQYGIGETPATFTSLTTTPVALTTGGTTWSNTDVTVNFGAALDNLAGPVWIRVIALSGSTGSGNRPTTAIDDFNLTWTNGAATSVADPTFLPAAGSYYNSVDVTLNCSTTDAEIRYTTDNSDPNATSTLYDGTPIHITTNTTIKAIGIKAGLTNSAISTASYTILTGTVCNNIAALRAQTADETTVYNLTGEALLTFQQSYRNQKYIEDATGAILIDDQAGIITTTYNVGDGITGIAGKLKNYFGMLEFIPVQNTSAASSVGNTLTPTDVTIAEMLDTTNFKQHQAKLVRIQNVSFSDANGTATFATNKKYRLTAGVTDSTFKTLFYNVDYINATIPQGTGTITGIVNFSYNKYQITSRSLSDINVSVGINDVKEMPFSVYPNPASEWISISNASDLKQVVVYDILGNVALSISNPNNQVNISSLSDGIYQVVFTDANGNKSVSKLIKK